MLWLPTLCLLSLLFGAIVEAVKKTKKMQALEQHSTVDNSWDNCPKTFMMYTKIQQKKLLLTYTIWQVKTQVITAKKMERNEKTEIKCETERFLQTYFTNVPLLVHI